MARLKDENWNLPEGTHWMPLPEAPADCDSEATSLEPGAPEQDEKKGSGSTPDETLRALASNVQQPHEWGYRGLVGEGFIADNTPFDLANAVLAARAPDETLREALERTLANFKSALAGRVIRDAAETIAEAERALATPTK